MTDLLIEQKGCINVEEKTYKLLDIFFRNIYSIRKYNSGCSFYNGNKDDSQYYEGILYDESEDLFIPDINCAIALGKYIPGLDYDQIMGFVNRWAQKNKERLFSYL